MVKVSSVKMILEFSVPDLSKFRVKLPIIKIIKYHISEGLTYHKQFL